MATLGTARLLRAGFAVLLAAAAALAAPGTAQAAGSWGTAVEIPGTAGLSGGNNVFVRAVSCRSAGNCSAGGAYADPAGHQQAFVVDEVNGTWGNAQEVPGTAALNAGGSASVRALSCSSAGNCSAGGSYSDSANRQQAFVVNEVNGTWRTAHEAPGTAALNADGAAGVATMSCPSAGNCSAGGFYTDAALHMQAFVVNEVSGTWRTAREVPGTATLNGGGNARVNSISCASAGNCSAAGVYRDASTHFQPFVASEIAGTWRTARQVPGISTLNAGGAATVRSLSCTSSGNCSAAGSYTDGAAQQQAFVVDQVSGTWHTAKEVPGTATLNTGGRAEVEAVSCGAAGSCSAGGLYETPPFQAHAFVVNRVNGVWGTAVEVPGTAGLGNDAEVFALSCPAKGACSAGGVYTDGSGQTQAFVADETNGVWGSAIEVPGTDTLNAGGTAEADVLSCGAVGNCAAAGFFSDASGFTHGFVANRS